MKDHGLIPRATQSEVKIINGKLIRAAGRNDAKDLKALLGHSLCDPGFRDNYGMTALMHAGYSGGTEGVQILLPLSDALVQDIDGMTALMYAASHGHSSCVQWLLPSSNVLAKTKHDTTALMMAAFSGSSDCIQMLLPVSEILVKDNSGHTAADHARARGYGESASLIDAYVRTMSEAAAIKTVTGPGLARTSHALRV